MHLALIVQRSPKDCGTQEQKGELQSGRVALVIVRHLGSKTHQERVLFCYGRPGHLFAFGMRGNSIYSVLHSYSDTLDGWEKHLDFYGTADMITASV